MQEDCLAAVQGPLQVLRGLRLQQGRHLRARGGLPAARGLRLPGHRGAGRGGDQVQHEHDPQHDRFSP